MSKDELMLDVGQANEFKLALRRCGDWTNQDIKILTEGDLLVYVLDVVRGLSEIKPRKFIINGDADPFFPLSLSLKGGIHRKNGTLSVKNIDGKLYLNDRRVELFLSKNQKNNNCVEGNKLRKEIEELEKKSKLLLNANVLDFLFKPENWHLIPEEWKKVNTFFWGTIYCSSDVSLCVRYLYWRGGGWCWGWSWPSRDWLGGGNPALLLAN